MKHFQNTLSGPALLHSLDMWHDFRNGQIIRIDRSVSGTSMLHEDHCQSHATLEPTLLQVRVSNSIQTRTWKKINHESWANLPFKKKLYLSVRNCNRQNDTHISCNWYVHVNNEKQHHRKTKLRIQGKLATDFSCLGVVLICAVSWQNKVTVRPAKTQISLGRVFAVRLMDS